MNRVLSLCTILVLLSICACSSSHPLHRKVGDQIIIRLQDGEKVTMEVLYADNERLFSVSDSGAIFKIELAEIRSLRVKGYNDWEVAIYGISAVVAATWTYFLIADKIKIDGPWKEVGLGITLLNTVGAFSSSSKYKFTLPLTQDDWSRLRLHFRYPQGVDEVNKRLLLSEQGQLDFLPLSAREFR